MKKIVFFSMTFISMSVFSQNIAFVSQAKVLEALPNYTQLEKERDSLRKVYQEELQKEAKGTNDKIDVLIKNYNAKENETLEVIKTRMKPLDLEKLNLLVEEDKFTQKKKESYEKQLTDFTTTNISPLLTGLNASINSYAVKNKIDAIYIIETMSSALAYYNKQKEITDKIVEIIKKK